MTNRRVLGLPEAHTIALRGLVLFAVVAFLLVGAGGNRAALAASAAGSGVIYVPASAHNVGVNGVNWRTDVEVHNPWPIAATFTVEMLKQNTDNGTGVSSRNFYLGPQASTRYTDILLSVFGFEGAAALRFTTTAGSILVTSRTYNLVGPNSLGLPVGASFGQFVPGLAADGAIAYGEEGRLIQLTHQAAATLDGFRTNVGLVNASSQTIDVTVDLYAADGSPLGSISGADTRLRPYEFRQLNALFGRFTASCADGYAVVKTTTPGGRLFAFASIVDNHASGDPIFIPATRLAGGSSASTIYVPASAHNVGVNGVNWRTDVEVHNPGATTAAFTVEILKQNTDNGTGVSSRSFSLGPQASTRYTDILLSVFGFEGAAALRFTTTAGSIFVTSRTYNLVGPNSLGLPVGASFGQFVPGLAAGGAIAYGEEGRLIQLTQQAAATLDGFRTNVGLVNATSQTIDVTVDLYTADGFPLGSISGADTRLRPYEFRQINALFGRFTASCADGYAVVKTTTSGGRLFTFASIVDNHSSGDPIFIPAITTTPPGPLALYPPSLEAPLLSGVPASLQVGARRASEAPLTFVLLESPAGAAIEARSGRITWTPPASAEGTSPYFRVSATDGQTTPEVAFTVPVASTSSVAASLTGPTLTITQSGTLQGVSFGLPSQLSRPASELRIYGIDPGQTPPIPAGVTRLSDFFRVSPVQVTDDDSSITLSFPARLVPSGAQPQDLRLYVYTDHHTTDDDPVWICTWSDLDVLPDGTVTMTLGELGDLSFVGMRTPGSEELRQPAGLPVESVLQVGAATVTVSCADKVLANGVADINQQVCTVSGDLVMTVVVKDFWRRLWKPAVVQDLVGWLVAARQKYETWGMKMSPVFEVVIETMKKYSASGFVSGRENYRVLHLDYSRGSRNQMQVTTVHEFFHHAQSRTLLPGLSNVIRTGGRATKWVVEGTASWAQSQVFADLDADKEFFGRVEPLVSVLAPGLDVEPVDNDPPLASDLATNAYIRAFFWKMVASRCPGFSPPAALNANLAGDPTAIRNLVSKMATPAWNCDFGAGFGDANKKTLASAMLYYLHATQKMNDIRRLDPAARPFQFAPSPGRRAPAECPPPVGCPWSATATGVFGPKSAQALEINPIPNLGADMEVTLEVEIGSPNVWVWIGDYDQHQELNQGTSFKTTGLHRYSYGGPGQVPKLFVATVNPSLDLDAGFTIRAVIRSTAPVVVPFSVTSQWTDDGWSDPRLKDLVVWTFTASGNVSGPNGMTVTPKIRTDISRPDMLSVTASYPRVSNLPFDVTFTGRYEGVAVPASGSFHVAAGNYTKHWAYTNARLEPNCLYVPLVTQASPSFSKTFNISSQNSSGDSGLCLIYTLRYWLTSDATGLITSDTTSDQRRSGLGLSVLKGP
jgi:hypothetical protein